MSVMQPHRSPRRASFGALTAGMIVRGNVPAQVLFGAAPPRDAAPVAAMDRIVPAALPVAPAPIAPQPVAPLPAAPVPLALAAAAPPPRKAVSVRLDADQHLRLRVLSACERRSAQDILVQALSTYLDQRGFGAAAS